MLLIETAELPELVRVAVFCPPALPTATLDQLIDAGETVTFPDEPLLLPAPESETESEVEPLVMVHVALSEPVVPGLKTMAAVQLAEAPRLEPQVVEEMEKSAALVPVIEPVLRVAELEVELVIVMVCDALLEPLLTVPKLRLVGVALTVPELEPPVPVPETETC